MRTLLLHNPTAGEGRPSGEELMDLLASAGFSAEYQSTKDGYKKALRKKWDLVIVAGGDGTVTKVARALDGHDKLLAILPIGTANNVARAIGLNGKIHTLISGLPNAKPMPLDVGLAQGPWGQRRFLEAVGFGTIAKAIAHSDGREKPSLGLRIYWGREDLLQYLGEATPERFEVKVDGEVFAGEFLLVEIMNLGRTGPALPISTTATHDDGLFDVVFLFESDRKPMLSWLETPESESPPVTVRKGREVRLSWERGHARIDDRVYHPPKKSSPVKVTLDAGGLRVLIPELPAHAG
jgi:diacylglycerol kinase family enzyme